MLAGCCCPPNKQAMVAHMIGARTTGEPMALLTVKYGAMSIAEAYEVQDALARELSDAGKPVVGYKIGMAGKGGQRTWGITEPTYGRLHKGMAVPDGGTIDLADYHTFHMEVEVAFVLAKRIDTPIQDANDLRACVKSVHPSFELPSNRFRSDQGSRKITDAIADNVGANRFVLGPAVDPAKVDLAKLNLTGKHNGNEVYAGPSANVAGSPWNALQWLANSLLRRGFALEAGDVVLSGAVAKAYSPKDKAPGDYVGDCGKLGCVTCKVVAPSK